MSRACPIWRSGARWRLHIPDIPGESSIVGAARPKSPTTVVVLGVGAGGSRVAPRRGLTVYRYSGYDEAMIRSFGDKGTEALFRDERVRQFSGIARVAKRKLEAVNAASRLEDLTIPPSNRLEKLKGSLKDFHSIRINDQWRVIFTWINGEPHEVRIVDYH
jgi:toxin HigB-1